MSNYPECEGCKRPMRSSKWNAADHPDTISYYSQGYCRNCFRNCGIPTTRKNEKQPKTDIDVSATAASLMAYLSWRKPFRAKAGQS